VLGWARALQVTLEGAELQLGAGSHSAAVEAALSESDPQGASQMRADFAARHYSWDSVIDRYEHLLTSLMVTPAPTSPRSAAS
jgi:hypothetical protein